MKSIVYYQPAFLGDACLAVPVLQLIRTCFPAHKVIFVCRKEFVSFFESLQVCDHAFGVIKNNPKSYSECAARLGAFEIDYLFSSHSSFTSFLFIRKVKAAVKVGYLTLLGNFVFDKLVPKNKQLHEVLRQMQLLAAVNSTAQASFMHVKESLAGSMPTWSLPRVKLRKDLLNELVLKYSLDSKFVCVFPGSQWGTKKWPAENYQKLVDELSSRFKVLVLGSQSEQELCQEVAKNQGINLAGQLDLTSLLHIISKAQAIVCNDSGAQHLAALVAAPTISIFGPTVPAQGFAPWNLKSQVVENAQLKCRPCGKHGPQVCPIGSHACMQTIDVQTVLSAPYL